MRLGGRSSLITNRCDGADGLRCALGSLLFVVLHKLAKASGDSLQTFAIWAKTGATAHVHPRTTYLIWLARQESPLLFLGALGAAYRCFETEEFVCAYSAALWAFGLIAGYSLIGYKTPWLVLNFVIPLALIAGYAIQAIYELDQRSDWNGFSELVFGGYDFGRVARSGWLSNYRSEFHQLR